MSVGSIVGGVAGGVVGWFVGGPYGAVAGASLGMGVGGLLIPPEVPDIGKPEVSDLSITMAEEGVTLPDLLGTTKIAGNIIHHWGNRSKAITEETSGGSGGGGEEVTTGYKYYLSWIQSICLGPVDMLYAVYQGDDLVWFGELSAPEDGGYETITLRKFSTNSVVKYQKKISAFEDDINDYTEGTISWEALLAVITTDLDGIDAAELNGLNDQYVNEEIDGATLTIEIIGLIKHWFYSSGDIIGSGSPLLGNVHFFFGTDTQEHHPVVEDDTENAGLLVPYRGQCYAVFDDYYVGKYNRAPVMKFVVGKYPALGFNDNHKIGDYDYNPAHGIWYILTRMVGLPEELLNSASFSQAADDVLADDVPTGIGILFNKRAAAETYLDSIKFHARAATFYDADGQIHIKMLRGQDDVEGMVSLSDDDFLDDPTFTRASWGETCNEVKGNYPLRIVTMPSYARLTSEFVEVLRLGTPAARLTSEFIEVLRMGAPAARLTSEHIEVLRLGTPSAKITSHFIEILREN